MISRYKPVGWRYESHKHALAAKGIKTRYDYSAKKKMSRYNSDKITIVNSTTGERMDVSVEDIEHHLDVGAEAEEKLKQEQSAKDEAFWNSSDLVKSSGFQALDESSKELMKKLFGEFMLAPMSDPHATDFAGFSKRRMAEMTDPIVTFQQGNKVIIGRESMLQGGSPAKSFKDMSAEEARQFMMGGMTKQQKWGLPSRRKSE